jgi:hypothetical protein
MPSPFYATILGVLPSDDEEAIPPHEIFQRLGIDRPTRAQRALLSRSLSRLAAQGLVVGLRGAVRFRNHNWSPSAPSGSWLISSEGRQSLAVLQQSEKSPARKEVSARG